MNLSSLKNAAIPAVPRNCFNRVILKHFLRQTSDPKVDYIYNFKLVAFSRFRGLLKIPWCSEETVAF